MPRRRLAREIAAVLVVKVLLLAGLFVAFFGPDRRLDVTPDAMQRWLSPERPPGAW